jgi:hypothetical protein
MTLWIPGNMADFNGENKGGATARLTNYSI